MGKGNIDIRIIQLAKWQIPKSKSMLEGVEESGCAYLAIGYFDMIEIVEVKNTKGQLMHPLSKAYYGLPRHGKTDASEEFTVQELILFTDVEEIGPEKIERFWKDTSLLMYISLIHVDNESDIEQIIKRIHTVFDGQQYLYYFSFDYSGIVLLAKNMKVETYMPLMFCLNYNETEAGKLIRDSFSLFGLNKKRLAEYFKLAEQGYANIEEMPEDETFSLVVNIGVQNFNTYTRFIEEVDKAGVITKKCGLLGRHDVSIINDTGNLKWLIYIQYLLNKYTAVQKDENYGQLFSTYETFVKVEMRETYNDVENVGEDKKYSIVEKNLNKLCKEFSARLTGKKGYYNGEYQIPVKAVKHSVLSILKNRFAEDFVLCMYSSFCEMLLYLTGKMSSNEDDPEAFEACFGEYFRGLNSLVNSAMHSERQFVQATAFNALIYDVPSKIMAFYVAIIHDVQKIIKSDMDKNYTFLLTPSFSNEISVKTISYQKEELPHDRILMVSINERSLYNPRAVSRRMAHEVAHYAGDEIRNRPYRKECFMSSVIYIILNNILHSVFIETEEFYSLIEKIFNILPKDKRFDLTEMNYSEDLTKVGAQIVEELVNNQEIITLLYEYIFRTVKNIDNGKESEEKKKQLEHYISQIIVLRAGSLVNLFGAILKEKRWSDTEREVMVKLIWGDLKEKINHMNRDQRQLLSLGEIEQSVALGVSDSILSRKTIGEYAAMLKSIYSEAFADIQMILLLDFGYKDYLNGFLVDENINLENLPNSMEDLARISMVAFTMNLVGMWDGLSKQDYFGNSDSKLRRLHEIIWREYNAMTQGIEFIDMENLEVLRKTVCEFNALVDNAAGCTKKKNYDTVKLKEDVAENVNDRMVNVYINNLLFQYLIICTENSIIHYMNKDKIKQIQKLRQTINTVINCENVKNTFMAICSEVNGYREEIFEEVSVQ